MEVNQVYEGIFVPAIGRTMNPMDCYARCIELNDADDLESRSVAWENIALNLGTGLFPSETMRVNGKPHNKVMSMTESAACVESTDTLAGLAAEMFGFDSHTMEYLPRRLSDDGGLSQQRANATVVLKGRTYTPLQLMQRAIRYWPPESLQKIAFWHWLAWMLHYEAGEQQGRSFSMPALELDGKVYNRDQCFLMAHLEDHSDDAGKEEYLECVMAGLPDFPPQDAIELDGKRYILKDSPLRLEVADTVESNDGVSDS